MKIIYSLMAVVLSFVLVRVDAQPNAPKGFKKGTIVMTDGSSHPGFIRDNIRNSASIVFFSDADGKKKSYDGSQLQSVEIEGTKFICITNDFFKLLSEGDLNFLQKSSDATGKIFYNGNDPIVFSGTNGRPGDYFIYNSNSRQLSLITKKNLDEVIRASFKNNAAALDKAKGVNGDLSQLKEAVDIYNKRSTN
jgi:hypothetical protein